MSSSAQRAVRGVPAVRIAPTPWAGLTAVVRQGLRDRWRAALTWGLSLGALGAFMAAIYPSIQSTIEQVAKNYPSGLKQAFGVESLNTVEGYVHAEMFSLIVPLAIGFFAVRAVSSATVGAEEAGHLDTILSLPLTRAALMVGSYVVMALVAAGIMAIVGACIFVAGQAAGTHISAGLVTVGVLGVWPLAMFFGGVAALAGGLLHSSRVVTAIAVGTVVAMYALDLAGRLAASLDAVRWLSAFRYYGAPMRDGLDVLAFAGLATAGCILVAAGAVLFERRDIFH